VISLRRRATAVHLLVGMMSLTGACQSPRADANLVVGGVQLGVHLGNDVSVFKRTWPRAKFIEYVGWVQTFDPPTLFADLIVPVDVGLASAEPRRAVVRRIQLTVARAALSDSVAALLDLQYGGRALVGCAEHPEHGKRVRIWEWRSEQVVLFAERAESSTTADASASRLLITVAGAGAQAHSTLNPREETKIEPCSDIPAP
jgi:hypothetical protein